MNGESASPFHAIVMPFTDHLDRDHVQSSTEKPTVQTTESGLVSPEFTGSHPIVAKRCESRMLFPQSLKRLDFFPDLVF